MRRLLFIALLGCLTMPSTSNAGPRPGHRPDYSALEASHADLFRAIKEGDVREVLAILSSSTFRTTGDINTPNADGLTPLHLATQTGNLRMVEILLAAGADPHTQEPATQQTALHVALATRQTDIAEVLFRHTTNLGLEDSIGTNVLNLAMIMSLQHLIGFVGGK